MMAPYVLQEIFAVSAVLVTGWSFWFVNMPIFNVSLDRFGALVCTPVEHPYNYVNRGFGLGDFLSENRPCDGMPSYGMAMTLQFIYPILENIDRKDSEDAYMSKDGYIVNISRSGVVLEDTAFMEECSLLLPVVEFMAFLRTWNAIDSNKEKMLIRLHGPQAHDVFVDRDAWPYSWGR